MLTTLCLAEMPAGTVGCSAPALSAVVPPKVQLPSAYAAGEGNGSWLITTTQRTIDLFAARKHGNARPLAPSGGFG